MSAQHCIQRIGKNDGRLHNACILIHAGRCIGRINDGYQTKNNITMGKYDDYDWAELPAEVQQAGELYRLHAHSFAEICHSINTHLIYLSYVSYHCYSFVIKCTSYQLPFSDTTRVSGIKTTNPTNAMKTGRI